MKTEYIIDSVTKLNGDTVSLCDNVKLAKAKDERAVAEQDTVAAFSMGKKVERCQGNRSIHALIPDARS